MRGKLITVMSPQTQVGKTTIANIVGEKLAKDNLVLVIDLCRNGSYLPFLHRNLDEKYKSLLPVLIDPNKLNINAIQDKKLSNLFYLCTNLTDKPYAMDKVAPKNLDIMIDKALSTFEYVILDLPTELKDPLTNRVLKQSEFPHKIHYNIIVIDENAQTLFKLNEYNSLLLESNLKRTKSVLAVNKSKYIFKINIIELLGTMKAFECSHIQEIKDVTDFHLRVNNGEVNILDSKMQKQFHKDIDNLVKALIEGKMKNPKEKKEKKGLFKKGSLKETKDPKDPKDPKEKKEKKEKKGLFKKGSLKEIEEMKDSNEMKDTKEKKEKKGLFKKGQKKEMREPKDKKPILGFLKKETKEIKELKETEDIEDRVDEGFEELEDI